MKQHCFVVIFLYKRIDHLSVDLRKLDPEVHLHELEKTLDIFQDMQKKTMNIVLNVFK